MLKKVLKKVNFMRFYRNLGLGILAALFLVSCSSTGSQGVNTPGSSSVADSGEGTSTTTAGDQPVTQETLEEAEVRIRREATERRLAEARAAEEAERRAEERRAEEQRLAQERAQREAEEAARREAERQREIAARRAEEQARIAAAQQARIEALRAQIAANEDETADLEAANAVLRQAVVAAEQLTDALAAEEEKYNNTDPATGEPVEELSTARLEELSGQVEALSNQAETLMAQP